MTEAYKVVWLDYGKSWFEARLTGNATSEKYHHDAEVQRLVAEARAEAFEEMAHIMPRYFGVWSSTGVHIGVWEEGDIAAKVVSDYPGGVVRDLIDQAAIRALSDVPPRQVTPQEAAKVLLSGKLTDDVIHAALAGHYGKRAAKASTIYGADMTANGVNYSFKDGFKRMFRAALRALANGGDSNG